MASTSSFHGARSGDPEDGWSPARSFGSASRATSTTGPPPAHAALPRDRARSGSRAPGRLDPTQDAYWAQPDDSRSARDRPADVVPPRPKEDQRGLPAWGALLVLLAIAGVGGAIDMISGTSVRGWFNVGIVVASIVAILLVRRRGMFPVVIAPPIVYSVASGLTLYVRSGGLDDRKVLIDSAANWLVYGFPAIAAATAAVLIIAGIRLMIRK